MGFYGMKKATLMQGGFFISCNLNLKSLAVTEQVSSGR